jgi:peptidoglycan/xylan/chitin deacetylase (PgdA/CDA1 family)
LITFDDGYEDNYTVGYPLLRQEGLTATIFVATDYVGGWSDFNQHLRRRMLSWEQLTELTEAGFEMGSHTCSHRGLDTLSPQEIRRELADSKKCLEDHLGREVMSVAYPFGAWNERIVGLAREVGYRVGFRVAMEGPGSALAVGRRTITARDNLARFQLRVWWNGRDGGWLNLRSERRKGWVRW